MIIKCKNGRWRLEIVRNDGSIFKSEAATEKQIIDAYVKEKRVDPRAIIVCEEIDHPKYKLLRIR